MISFLESQGSWPLLHWKFQEVGQTDHKRCCYDISYFLLLILFKAKVLSFSELISNPFGFFFPKWVSFYSSISKEDVLIAVSWQWYSLHLFKDGYISVLCDNVWRCENINFFWEKKKNILSNNFFFLLWGEKEKILCIIEIKFLTMKWTWALNFINWHPQNYHTCIFICILWS